jgi:hypothetical protein
LYETIDNLTEYVVNIEVLKSLASEYGLEMTDRCNFGDFFERNKQEYKKLLFRMTESNSFDRRLLMSDQEWEVALLYQVLLFKKMK